ncbi:MAG: phosphate-starvation-inducible PsiE family protein [Cocleimonas sp.]|nr:phosphate-starvation-inducible PsiE family protein [Cocleimonas sp.]
MNNKAVFKVLHAIEQVGLLIILIATLIAVGQEIVLMFEQGKVELKDLLLLFIYLEVMAMIQIYYEQHKLPIRFPIYIAIVALARYIILDSKSFDQWRLLEISLTIIILTLAVLVVRYGHVRYSYPEIDCDDAKKQKQKKETTKP